MSLVEIAGCGSGWAVLVNGKQVGRTHSNSWNAEVAAVRVQSQLHRQTRPCLRCREPFDSYGKGHRLCDACNRFARTALA